MFPVFSICSHDVAEIAGLTTFSFGEDEIDRYVMLFKKVKRYFMSANYSTFIVSYIKNQGRFTAARGFGVIVTPLSRD